MEDNCTFEQGEVVEVSDYLGFPENNTHEAKFVANLDDNIWGNLFDEEFPYVVFEDHGIQHYKYVRKLQPKFDIISYGGSEYTVERVVACGYRPQEVVFHCCRKDK